MVPTISTYAPTGVCRRKTLLYKDYLLYLQVLPLPLDQSMRHEYQDYGLTLETQTDD